MEDQPLKNSANTADAWQDVNMQNIIDNLTNVTSELPEYQLDLITAAVAGCLVGLIILLIVFGNAMVIIAIVKDRYLKQALQNRFIMSLAIADMLLGILIMPLSLHVEILHYWALGRILCDIWLAVDVFLCTASTLSLVVVSLDRYWSVTKALEYPQLRTAKKVNITIAGIWMTSALVSLPPLAGWKSSKPTKDDVYPQCNLSDELGYIVYSLTISFYIPLVIILLAYGRIFLVARRRANQHIKLGTIQTKASSSANNNNTSMAQDKEAMVRSERQRSLESIASSNLSLTEQQPKPAANSNQNGTSREKAPPQRKMGIIVHRFLARHSDAHDVSHALLASSLYAKHQARREKANRGRERRATLTIAILVMAFMICWLPFSTLYLIDRLCLCGIRDHLVFTVIFWLGYCNSAINPLLYSIFNRDFRQAFQRLLCHKRR